MMNQKYIILLLLLMFAGTASATDYYLATNGDNGNSGTSIAQAWRNASYADGQLYPGDTLWVLDGTYYESASFQLTSSHVGNATHWITIKAYNGTPIWDGSNGTVIAGFLISYATNANPYSAGYIELDGITITNYKYAEIVLCNVCNITFRNCTFSNSPDWKAVASIGAGIRDIIIDNCSILNSGDHGIALLGDGSGTSRRTYDVSITDCYFENSTHHAGIQLTQYTTDIVIENNTFHDCYSGVGTYYTNLSLPTWHRNIIIRNNTFTNIWHYPLFALKTNDSTFYDNTASISGKAFMSPTAYCDNLTIRDNTINGSLYIHDDYQASNPNAAVIYQDNTHTNTSSATDYILRGGGGLKIINDAHLPNYRVEMRNTATVDIEYSDGRVFSYSTAQSGAGYSYTPIEYFPDRSNITMALAGTDYFITDVTPYNITLIPTNAYLKNVTVNRESNSTSDVTNITANSSVSSNPTWINATMQNASANYSVSIDSSIVGYVDADVDGIARYQHTASWSSHDFEFNWVSAAAFVPDHTKAYYNATSAILNTINSTGYYIWDRTIISSDVEISSGSMKVTI